MKRKVLALMLILALSLSVVAGTHFVNLASAQYFGGAITIKADGRIEGTDMILRNGDIYTLVDDISMSISHGTSLISIEKDNVVLDGAGHTIQGTKHGIGIELKGRNNVVVKNTIIDNFGIGIDVGPLFDYENDVLVNSTNNRFLNNHITAVYDGISLSAIGNSVIGNTIVSPNSKFGIYLQAGYGNTIADNTLIGGGLGLYNKKQSTFHNNTLDGKPVVVLEDAFNQVIDNAGQVLLFDCNNITVKNVNPSADLKIAIKLSGTNNSQITKSKGSIFIENSHHNVISKNQMRSTIEMFLSHNNEITQNAITSSGDFGINLEFCLNNNIYANSISNSKVGIGFVGSNNNNIQGNMIIDCETGIELTYTHHKHHPTVWAAICVNNLIHENRIIRCNTGISLNCASNNEIFANKIADSTEFGIWLSWSDNNAFYHNNLDNKQHIYERHLFYNRLKGIYESYYAINNTWDAGYPSGGNFWSDYKGIDANGDGIGDTPYTVYENNLDRYPLMEPFVIPEPSIILEPTDGENTIPPYEEPFPIVLAITASGAAIAIVSIGLLVYFKKR